MEYYDDNIVAHTNLLTNKYKPTNISEIVGNKRNIDQIVTWLNNFVSNKKKIFIDNVKNKTKTKKGKKIKIPKIEIDENIIDEDYLNNDLEAPDPDMNNDIDNNIDLIDETNYISNIHKTNEPKSCLLITGNHGVGKTTCIHAILNDLGYTIQIINFSKITTGKNIKDVIERITNSSDILKMMDGQKNVKNVIVIDELESLTSLTEKNCISALIKTNESNWFCPIIFISNNQHNKLLSDIKKNSMEIRFWPPYPNEMLVVLKKICDKENINMSNQAIAYKIIEHSQKDFRRLIFILQDLKYAFGKKTITMEMIDDYCTTSQKKDVDFDLFNATELLLHSYKSVDDCMIYYETEKTLLPLMIHQNYIKSILAVADENDIDTYNNIYELSELLSKGDVVENYIYGDQNWDMCDVHGFYTCVITSFILSNINPNMESAKLDFPMDLNRTSIQKINKKNILNANKCLNTMNIHDYIYINQIVRNMLNDGKNNECIRLFDGYNIKMEHIESLLKVDKIQSSKTNLAPKQKKELMSYLDS
jgi:DNA polymerase III delta prime subunit